MSVEHLEDLRAQAQYARERYQLYKAKAYGRGPAARHACGSSNGPDPLASPELKPEEALGEHSEEDQPS
jgi:hypothetical protein